MHTYTLPSTKNTWMTNSSYLCDFVYDVDPHFKKSIYNHVQMDDYFGTLATVIDLIRQYTQSKNQKIDTNKLLKEIVEELQFLQKNFTIVPKKN